MNQIMIIRENFKEITAYELISNLEQIMNELRKNIFRNNN